MQTFPRGESEGGRTAEPLFKSLNPITKYKLNGATKALSTATKWNIGGVRRKGLLDHACVKPFG